MATEMVAEAMGNSQYSTLLILEDRSFTLQAGRENLR
jgi:hypothetical protein